MTNHIHINAATFPTPQYWSSVLRCNRSYNGSIGHVLGRHHQGQRSQSSTQNNTIGGSCQTDHSNETSLCWPTIKNTWSTYDHGEPRSTYQSIVSEIYFASLLPPDASVMSLDIKKKCESESYEDWARVKWTTLSILGCVVPKS